MLWAILIKDAIIFQRFIKLFVSWTTDRTPNEALTQNLEKHQFFSNIIQKFVVPCHWLTLKIPWSSNSSLIKILKNFVVI